MKRIWLFVAALVLLAGVAPVRAQGLFNGGYRPSSWEGWVYYFKGDQVHMLQADMVNFVAETLDIDERRALPRVTDNIARSGPYVGLPGPKGFYPLYQCSGGQRWKRGIGTVLLAGGIGYIVGHTTPFGEREGVAAGLGIGTGLALYLDSNKCSPIHNQMVVIDDPSDVGEETPLPSPHMRGISTPAPSASAGRENGWNERLRDQANRGRGSWFGSYRGCMEQGQFTLKNDTPEVIRVYQNSRPYTVLMPRESDCGDPFAAYDAEVVTAVADGYTATAGVARAKPEGRSGGLWIWR